MNNIAKALQFTQGAMVYNNTAVRYDIPGYESVFRNFSANDFRPKAGSPFVGTGNSGMGAPTIDVTGKTRKAPYDQGCYDYE